MTLLMIVALLLGWLTLSVLLAAAIGQRRPLPAPPSPRGLVIAPGQSAAMLLLLHQERHAAITVSYTTLVAKVAASTWDSPFGVRCGLN